jgi:Transcriptional Coactivator p15 (PC4)
VSVHEFNGHDMLSVRVYVGQAKPTQKGITVNVLTLPELISLLQEAEAKARAEGLLS